MWRYSGSSFADCHTELPENGINKLCRNIIRGALFFCQHINLFQQCVQRKSTSSNPSPYCFLSLLLATENRWAQRIKLKQAAFFPAADMKANRGKCTAHELGAHESMVISFSLSGSTSLAVEERLEILQLARALKAHLHPSIAKGRKDSQGSL